MRRVQPENGKNIKVHLEGLVLGAEALLLFFFFFLNLAALDLSCSRQDLVPWPGMESRPLNGKFGVLTAEPLGKSPNSRYFPNFLKHWYTFIYTAAAMTVLSRDAMQSQRDDKMVCIQLYFFLS